MKRRGFLGSLAALFFAPKMAATQSDVVDVRIPAPTGVLDQQRILLYDDLGDNEMPVGWHDFGQVSTYCEGETISLDRGTFKVALFTSGNS